jgi:hypothetical protein
MQSIGVAVNLWGRNLLGNDVVDTMSSTENLKNLFGGEALSLGKGMEVREAFRPVF